MDPAESIEPLIRVMALHALEYCERLYYLEEVEEIRIADKAVYDGRRFHQQLPEYVEITSYPLQSDTLGIFGKVDCVRSEGGEWIPFEYKKGHSKNYEKDKIDAWPPDKLQVAAYALLLEEHFDRTISEGRIYYAADHRTVRILINDEMREWVKRSIERARYLRKTIKRPPISKNERLCARCSLAPVCLPEEERLIQEGKEDLPRYFPPDRDQVDLHILQHGTTIRRSSGTFILENREGIIEEVSSESIGSITIHGHSQITTQAIHLASMKGIHIHWMTSGGKYVGSLVQSVGGTQRRLRQYEGLTNESLTIRLSQSLVYSKVESQLRYILRLTRGTKERDHHEENLQIMRESLRRIRSDSPKRDALLGYEGMAAKAYFNSLSLIISEEGNPMFFNGRNRRPPRDPANAILSFLYSLLYRDAVQAIVTVGLDPTIGFYHQPRSQAYPLALDLMELFRVMLCDTILVGTIHRRQWDVEKDFETAGKQVWLSEEGKKKAIRAYEKRKQDTWKHPVVGYSLTYDRTMELEVRLLEKEWSGVPGLFAMNRIR
ncbi:CRISPR-associated protein Cas4/endonuclease Cas1 fusion [[Clostridium] ultunense Esp]|nr:CRISPR-associated protein Cas4/endonuclease Cas1 fusion [[Clostridium] ultunense Esp]